MEKQGEAQREPLTDRNIGRWEETGEGEKPKDRGMSPPRALPCPLLTWVSARKTTPAYLQALGVRVTPPFLCFHPRIHERERDTLSLLCLTLPHSSLSNTSKAKATLRPREVLETTALGGRKY